MSQTAVTVSSSMTVGKSVSFVVDLYDLYVNFDAAATTSSMLVPAGSGFSQDNMTITGTIRILNRTAGENGRIRGFVAGD